MKSPPEMYCRKDIYICVMHTYQHIDISPLGNDISKNISIPNRHAHINRNHARMAQRFLNKSIQVWNTRFTNFLRSGLSSGLVSLAKSFQETLTKFLLHILVAS